MLNKTFSHGTGGGKGPVDYCVNITVPQYDPETRRRIPGEFVTRDPAPVVLSGDPQRTKNLIDSVDNKWKYTSGVIPFTVEDAPTPEEIREVIRTFEDMAFAGLEKDQYDVLWTMHTHEGNIELHYVTPRVELGSGKALNICPPGYLKMFDAWRDEWNFRKGWSRPDDPARAKLTQVGDHQEKTDAARLKAGLEKCGPTKAKEEITAWLVERIKSGTVTDRAGVMASLAEIGTITRVGDTYISVQPEGFTKAFRLKGAIYGESFEPSQLVADFGIEESDGRSRGGQRDESRAAEARERLAEAVKRRADYNSACYHPERRERNAERRAAAHAADRPDPTGDQQALRPDAAADRPGSDSNAIRREREAGQDAGADRRPVATAGRESAQAAHGETARADQPADQAIGRGIGEGEARQRGAITDDRPVMAQASIDRPNDLGQYLRASLGADAIPGVASAEQPGHHKSAGEIVGAAAREVRSNARQNRVQDLGDPVPGRQEREVLDIPAGGGAVHWLESWKQVGSEVWQKLKGLYDRTRETFSRWVDETIRAVRSGAEAAAGASLAAAGANQGLVITSQQLVTASRVIDEAAQRQRNEVTPGLKQSVQQFERTAQRAVGVLKVQRDDELARFKTDINLVAYCAGCGFELDEAESSGTSTIMRRGREKIGVAVDTDGHWIYSDLRNEGRGGSIIDFVQHTQNLNLGQVRKELRGAAGHIAQIPIAQRPRKPQRSSHSRQAVMHAYIKARSTGGTHDYLQNDRGIESSTLEDPRFSPMVKVDPRGNAIFPHYDEQGLSGYEIRGQDFKGFSKHGEKTIWHSANLEDAHEVIFVEGAINALSHAQLHPNPQAAYVSIGGQMSQQQKQLVAKVMRDAAGRGAVIVLATDADDAGEAHAQALKALAPAGAKIERDRPQHGMDWNEQTIAAQEQQQRQHEYESHPDYRNAEHDIP